MTKWNFTSFEDGKETSHSGLSHEETVRVINRVMSGEEPFPQTEVRELERRQPVTAETADKHLVAA